MEHNYIKHQIQYITKMNMELHLLKLGIFQKTVLCMTFLIMLGQKTNIHIYTHTHTQYTNISIWLQHSFTVMSISTIKQSDYE